jgi:hypothetical protein
VRLRDVSVAVGDIAFAVTQAIEGTPAGNSADTLTDLTLASITGASGVAMNALSGQATLPRAAAAVTVEALGFALTELTTEPTTEPTIELTQRHAAVPGEVAPSGRLEWGFTPATPQPPAQPRSRRRALILLVIAVLAMEAGVVVGRLLA